MKPKTSSKMSKGKEGKMDSRALEKRLSAVRETSEDIQGLSRWCLQHKNHHHIIIHAWSRAVRKSKVPHRLTLFYVCNDIVQNARRKKVADIVQHFATAIKESVPLVRDEKIRHKIVRIFNIWEERGIYDAKLIAELTETIENVGTVNASENEIVLSSFQPVQLVEGMRSVMAMEKTTESLLVDLKNQEFSLTDEEINQLRESVKERGTSRERMEEFEEAVIALECYISSVQKEIEERTQVVTLLEQAEIFYETQRGEAKLVANAYKNFGNRVKNLKSKLLEKMKSLPEPSPIPSPTVDAPSPENSDDEMSLPESGSSGMVSFLNSSKFADVLTGGGGVGGGGSGSGAGDLEARISAMRKEEKGGRSKSSSSGEIKDVHTIREGSQSSDSIEMWEDPKDSSSGWEPHPSKSKRDTDERKESHDSWDRDGQRRDYVSVREHRSSRSSRDSRDSRDGDGRDQYRSSSWEHGDREYPVKSRDRDYTSSYDSPLQPPKDLKPMSAKELLDTFGKAYLSKSSSGTGSGSSNTTSPATPAYEPTKGPATPTPQGPIPDLSRPPPSLSIPLPPTNPPASEPTSPFTPVPFNNSRSYAQKSHYSQVYPLSSDTPTKTSFTPTQAGDQPPYPPPFDGPPSWVPPPPPPPPPPELDIRVGSGTDYEMSRSYVGGWSDYDQYGSSGDLQDEDADDRNWGEPPGNEELEAFHSDTPSSPPAYEKGFTSTLHPPPLPPAFTVPPRSNLRELTSEGEDSDHRTNLVSIKPRGADADYRCYDYSSLSDPAEGSTAPSVRALFNQDGDQDLRVRKSGIKQNVDSGSDMDISDSEEEDDMDISDGSGKDGTHKKDNEGKQEVKQTRESKSSSSNKANKDDTKQSSEGNHKKDTSAKVVHKETSKSEVKSTKSDVVENVKNISSISSISSVLETPRHESKKMKREGSRDSQDSHDGVKVSKRRSSSDKKSEKGSNGDVRDISDSDKKGRNWYNEFSAEKSSIKEEGPIPIVIAKSGGRGNADRDYPVSRNYSENNVIDVMRNLDKEFNQSKDKEIEKFESPNNGRGNYRGHYRGNNSGGGSSRGHQPYQGKGDYYSPHGNRGRGWNGGGPSYSSPRGRGRGGDYYGNSSYSPSGRGYHGFDGYAGHRGGRRGGRGGRGWW